jgi:drug/metabolite transporter (DMT)-like permease
LNYLGVLFAALSGIFFLFITSGDASESSNSDKKYETSVEFSQFDTNNTDENNTDEDEDFPFLSRLSPSVQKTVGCSLAALAGLFYGLMFIPDQYIRDHKAKYMLHGAPPANNGINYIYSQYCGILLSSMIYFVLYAIFKKNKPSINPSIALPAMVSGVMWAVANIGFILAISGLTSAVAYPIVNVMPGIVSSLWSLFWFREIQGRKNYILLSCGMGIRVLAALLSGLSS